MWDGRLIRRVDKSAEHSNGAMFMVVENSYSGAFIVGHSGRYLPCADE